MIIRNHPNIVLRHPAGNAVILIAFLFAILAGAGISPAGASQVDCKELISKIKSGAPYAVSIDIQKEAMRVQTASNFCFDPIDRWIKRGLDLTSTPPLSLGAPQISRAPVATAAPSLPRPSNSDTIPPPPALDAKGRVIPSLTNVEKENAPPSMSFTGGGGIRKARRKPATGPTTAGNGEGIVPTSAHTSAHTSVGAEGKIALHPDQNPGSGDAAGGAKCNSSLENFWQAGTVNINGKRNWLLGVYTIDQNDDNITDNLVFKLRTQGRVDRVIRYFPVEPGDIAAKDIADLKLDHANMVGRICSDNLMFKGPTAQEMAIAAGKDSPALHCKWKLKDFWSEGAVDIKGTEYWLSGVFSIDLDSDGRVDNIGFKLKTRGKVGNVIRYFPMAAGRLSGQTIADLALKDDNIIFKICADDLTFARPKSSQKIAVTSVITSPGGKKPGEQKKKNKKPIKKEPSKPSIFSKLKLKHFVLIVGLILIGGSIYGVYTIKRKDDDDEEEDDEEYEEDEEYEDDEEDA